MARDFNAPLLEPFVAAETAGCDSCEEEGIAEEVAPALARLTGQQMKPLEADARNPLRRMAGLAGLDIEQSTDPHCDARNLRVTDSDQQYFASRRSGSDKDEVG